MVCLPLTCWGCTLSPCLIKIMYLLRAILQKEFVPEVSIACSHQNICVSSCLPWQLGYILYSYLQGFFGGVSFGTKYLILAHFLRQWSHHKFTTWVDFCMALSPLAPPFLPWLLLDFPNVSQNCYGSPWPVEFIQHFSTCFQGLLHETPAFAFQETCHTQPTKADSSAS